MASGLMESRQLASRPDSMITLNCPRIRVGPFGQFVPAHAGHVNVGDQDFNSAVAGKFFQSIVSSSAVITKVIEHGAVTSRTSGSSSTTRTTRDKWQLPKQHLAIIQRLGVLGCSAGRVPSRIRSQQSSAPRVLLDGRKSAKIDGSLGIIWGIPDKRESRPLWPSFTRFTAIR